MAATATRGCLVALLPRGQHSVEELASSLGLTDNRHEDTVGKPATLDDVAPESGRIFFAAYAPLFSAVLAELGERMTSRQLESFLRAAGKRLATAATPRGTLDERVRASAAIRSGLGAEADLVETSEGYEIRGFGCPLSNAVTGCPATCRALRRC